MIKHISIPSLTYSKKRHTTSCWALLLLCFSASIFCSSCLSENPKDQLDEDQIYNSANDIYANAVASLYNYIGGTEESEGLQGTCRGVYDYNTLTTDEAIIPIRGGDWYDGGLWNAMYQHQWTADDQSLYDTWKYLYKVIVLANKSIDIIHSKASILSSAQYDSYMAEVKAIRAMFYYYAMDLFGRVPLVISESENTDFTKTANSSNSLPQQAERSETFRFVFSQLQAALPYLPDEHSNLQGDYYGRLTRPVAHFLLAKLALNAEIYTYDDWTKGYAHRPSGKDIFFNVPIGKTSTTSDTQKLNAWQTCIFYCYLLQEENYALESDYAFNFSTHNETSKENIFTIPMDKNVWTNQFHYLFRSYHYAHGGKLGWGSENGTCATISTMKANHYGEPDEDTRCKVNFIAGIVEVDGSVVTLDNGDALEYQPFEVEQNLTNSPYMKTAGARMGKYEADKTSYMDGKLPNNDIVLFRYADALLMKAEAKVRNGDDGSAELNEVRARVGMDTRQATLSTLLEERLLELVWEGWRRQDLIRFGLFGTVYDLRTPLPNEANGYTTVFPIPNKCISLNANLVQNKGY